MEAQAAHALPPSRTYHGFGHALRLHEHAARTFRLAYDPGLDLAVLTHDVPIDGPGSEDRSSAWLLERKEFVHAA